MSEAAVLVMWTVYDHPTDFPDVYVARRFDIVSGAALVTPQTIMAADLDVLRQRLFEEADCTDRLPRDPNDDPKILEVWLADAPSSH